LFFLLFFSQRLTSAAQALARLAFFVYKAAGRRIGFTNKKAVFLHIYSTTNPIKMEVPRAKKAPVKIHKL
jgi:hypothetical protein